MIHEISPIGSKEAKPEPNHRSMGERLSWLRRELSERSCLQAAASMMAAGLGRASGSESNADRDAYDMLEWASMGASPKPELARDPSEAACLLRSWIVRELGAGGPSALGVAGQLAGWGGLMHAWIDAPLPVGQAIDADALARMWSAKAPQWIGIQGHLCEPIERLLDSDPERFLPRASEALEGKAWFGEVLDRWMQSNLASCPPAMEAYLATARAQTRSNREYKDLEARMSGLSARAKLRGPRALCPMLGARLALWARWGLQGGFLAKEDFEPRIKQATMVVGSATGEGEQSAFAAEIEALAIVFHLRKDPLQAQGRPSAMLGRRL